MEINILGQKYKVVEVEHIEEQGKDVTISDVDHVSNEIKILKVLPKERKENTLWYEIIVAILDTQGYDERNINPEVVCALATGIHNVLKDNDNLM